jgi:hypothetical protein
MPLEMEDEEQQIRDELSGHFLHITKGRSFMLANIDSFVALSRDNSSVEAVVLYPFGSDAGNYEFWDETMSFGTKWVKSWEISWSSS